MSRSSLPRIISKDEKPIDGVFEKTHTFCNQNFNSNCKEHYQKIGKIEGFHVCPYGFTTYVASVNNKQIIYTSIEVDKKINRKLLKKNKKKNEKNKRFSASEIIDLVKWESNLEASITAKKNILRDYDKNVLHVSQKKEVLDDTLHELRKLNNVLKKQAFLLKSEVGKYTDTSEELKLRAKNIYATSQLVSARLNAYDFTLNPEIIETNPPANLSLYRKFEKAKHCLEVITSELGIPINFIGQSREQHNCFEIVDVLPFILFENAIKFCHEKQPIQCKFKEVNGKLHEICIVNKALLPKEEDLVKLKNKHFRSINIENIKGTGKGLYIASLICEYHNIELSIETANAKYHDGKKIGDFIIKLDTSNANNIYSN